MKVYSVRECSSLLANVFQKDYIFKNITVSGTVSSLRFHFSGVIFFSLIDDNFRIICRIGKMRSTFLRRKIKNGTTISVIGNIKYDKIRGKPVFQIDRVLSSAKSPILLKLEILKEKLTKEGYFDPQVKQKLPLFPFKIGIITSESGAVIHDIIRTGYLRNNSIRYTLYSTGVQGETAAGEMAKMVHKANTDENPPDILIIARGGGSEEDLAPFNDRILLDAVFQSKIPIISAIGHETDVTLLDLVADVRASTPTQAAEMAIPEKINTEERIRYLQSTLSNHIQYKLNMYKLELSHSLNMLRMACCGKEFTEASRTVLYKWIILDRIFKKSINTKKMIILESVADILLAEGKYSFIDGNYKKESKSGKREKEI